MRFNSTMVRLKEIANRYFDRYKQCFNSTMVRLKAVEKIFCIDQIDEFQFHNGSIKSGGGGVF